MTERYFEDFHAGECFESDVHLVGEADIIRFGEQFDPQPFHTDPTAAGSSFFGGLVASGWHTAAITMKLIVNGELRTPGGLIGLAVDELRWTKPVQPGDLLHVESEILEVKPSRNPRRGTIKVRSATVNQSGETVQTFIATILVDRRPTNAPNEP